MAGCGCGSASTEKFQVKAKDNTVRTFATKAEAQAFAIQQGGGIVTRV